MNSPGIKSSYALLLQLALVLLGVGILAFLLGEPHLEGRNAHATTFEIYFHDPFLAYVYVGSIPFFVALYRAFGLFGDVRRNGTFSTTTVAALCTIQRCALVLLGFVAGGIIFVAAAGDADDRPAGFVMGLFVALVTGAVATAASIAARKLQRALAER